MGTPTLLVKTHLWTWWAEIAFEHDALARRSRALMIEAGRIVEEHFKSESFSSMIAVSAAAHAIDGLYGEISEFVPVPRETRETWAKNGTSRWARILETLRLGFAVGRHTKSWAQEFAWLYRLRDAAVHHQPAFTTPEPHPVFPTNTGRESTIYVCEASERATKILATVASTCVERPRSSLPAAAVWSANMKTPLAGLLETRPRA